MSQEANPDALPGGPALEDEEKARADLYALLGRLFYGPPDAALLRAIVGGGAIGGEEANAPLALAWRDLGHACAASNEDAARVEYDSLFIGTGKAEISLYLGAYSGRGAADRLLLDLKEFLAARGLARRESAREPEDHIAAVFEVMRHLIAGERASVADQKAFFNTYVWSGATALCDAIVDSPKTDLYEPVARFARSFLELERTAFDLG